MALLHYVGPERKLMDPPLAAAELQVEQYDVNGDSIAARGTITCIDYVEGAIRFTDPWEAVGTGSPGARTWAVRRTDDGSPTWRHRETNEPELTLSEAANKAIKAFIAELLGFYEPFAPGPLVMGLHEFVGQRDEYDGPCVCEHFRGADGVGRTELNEFMQGRSYPHQCFRCSCGTRWWQPDPDQRGWLVVADDQAWEGLIRHNGEPDRLIGVFEGQVYNLQTLRDQGFIPIS